MNQKPIRFTLIGISLNLLFSIASLAASNTATVTIDPCTVNCLGIEAPNTFIFLNELNQTPGQNPQFIPETGNIFYFLTNTNSLIGINKFKVFDLRDLGGFEIFINSSDYISNSDSSKKISYQNIGIFSFNDTANTSTDTNSLDDPVISLIDPVENGSINSSLEPYNLNSFLSNPINPDSIIYPNFYTKFTGSGINSDPIQLINATSPPSGGRVGIYEFGLGGFIKLSNTEFINNNLIDDTYSVTFTFTLV